MNENGDSFGKFCGDRKVQPVVVNGSLVVLRFRAGNYGGHGRFRLLLTPVYRKYNNDMQSKCKNVQTGVVYKKNFIVGEQVSCKINSSADSILKSVSAKYRCLFYHIFNYRGKETCSGR